MLHSLAVVSGWPCTAAVYQTFFPSTILAFFCIFTLILYRLLHLFLYFLIFFAASFIYLLEISSRRLRKTAASWVYDKAYLDILLSKFIREKIPRVKQVHITFSICWFKVLIADNPGISCWLYLCKYSLVHAVAHIFSPPIKYFLQNFLIFFFFSFWMASCG